MLRAIKRQYVKLNMFDLGLRIKELREEHHWTQEELGKKINKSKSMVSLYESNIKIPSGETLIDLAYLFNVSLDYLVGIDKKEMVSIEKLSERQKTLVHTLLIEFRDDSRRKGLSPRQQDILSGLMTEFVEKSMKV